MYVYIYNIYIYIYIYFTKITQIFQRSIHDTELLIKSSNGNDKITLKLTLIAEVYFQHPSFGLKRLIKELGIRTVVTRSENQQNIEILL